MNKIDVQMQGYFDLFYSVQQSQRAWNWLVTYKCTLYELYAILKNFFKMFVSFVKS
jgi:hypothetical protein